MYQVLEVHGCETTHGMVNKKKKENGPPKEKESTTTLEFLTSDSQGFKTTF